MMGCMADFHGNWNNQRSVYTLHCHDLIYHFKSLTEKPDALFHHRGVAPFGKAGQSSVSAMTRVVTPITTKLETNGNTPDTRLSLISAPRPAPRKKNEVP